MVDPARNERGTGQGFAGGEQAANLEIHISRLAVDQYSTELRFTAPGNDADTWYPGSKLVRFAAQFGTDAEILPKAVGGQIRDDLCSDPEIKLGLEKILASVDTAGDSLHVRLFIDPSASELQLLPWETLLEPSTERFLFAGERRSFSRFLAGSDFGRMEVGAGPLEKAEIVVANPASANLAPFDVAAQVALAQKALSDLQLKHDKTPGSATLDRIVKSVRDGTDLLYLVCHGAIHEGEPYLYLENPDGGLARVRGEDLIERLQELLHRPRLIVLLSCRSGGDDAQFQAALGPRLASIGVPAVLAMRGDVPIESAREFLTCFFAELRAHGVLDRAVSLARRAVAVPGDAWMPVLFSRLRTGRLWQRTGFIHAGGDGKLSEQWDSLINRIADGRCTPILGPLLTEPLIGSSREIALQWSSKFGFPLAPQDRENLSSVAQYLATNLDPSRPRELFLDHIRQTIWTKYGERLGLARTAPLDSLLQAAWQTFSQDDPAEPHRLLATLPFPIFLTTNTNLLLERALEQAGRRPDSALYQWNDSFDGGGPSDGVLPDYNPNAAQPLVFHLFGHMDQPGSGPLLTEDDYFDYLIRSATRREQLPPVVKYSLVNRALLFLGFHIDDWSFRVLFRSLMNHENKSNMKRFTHIAVQIDPEEGRILEPERARRYLETYFKEIGNISIFWGSVHEFTRELGKHWAAAAQGGDG